MPERQKKQDKGQIKEKNFPLIPWKIFIFEAFLFSLTIILGIFAAFKMSDSLVVRKITIPQISFWQFILNFAFVVALFLFVVNFARPGKRKSLLLKGFFLAAVFLGCFLWIETWMTGVISLFLTALLVFWRIKKPLILNHNILIIFSIAGIGSFLGLHLEPRVVLGLLIVFSVYDFIAVYKTKHMIKMAKEMMEEKAIPALIVPLKFSDFLCVLEPKKIDSKFLILGGGDVVFPLLFCSSLVSQGVYAVFVVVLFSLVGLLAGFWLFMSQKTRQPIPALPPIALFSIIGFLITRLLYQ